MGNASSGDSAGNRAGVFDSAVPASAKASAPGEPTNRAGGKSQSDKKVTRIYWTYGSNRTPISGQSRFYVDLNLHAETENYGIGEKVEVAIANDAGGDIVDGLAEMKVFATVGEDGEATCMNVFAGKTVEI